MPQLLPSVEDLLNCVAEYQRVLLFASMAKQNVNKDGRGMNAKGKIVSMPKLTPVKPTEAITAKGQKATGLGKSTKDNRFASTAKTPVKSASKGFAGSASPLGTSIKLSQPTKASNVAKAVMAATALPGSGQLSRWAAGKIGAAAGDTAFGAAAKGLEATGAGGKVSRTFSPMGPTLRSTRIGTEAQQAARMGNLLKNAERVANATERGMANKAAAAFGKAAGTTRSVIATGAAAKIVKDSKKKK